MTMDRFVDTPSKRRCAWVVLTACLLFAGAVQNGKLGLSILPVERYDELFELLSSRTLSGSYLSRTIYTVISQASITPWIIVKAVFASLQFFEISLIVITGGFLFMKGKDSKSRRWLYVGLSSFVILLLLCIWCVCQGLSAVSLNMVIDQLHIIGLLLIVQSGFQMLTCLGAIYCCIMYEYLPAMRVTVEYIEE